MFPKSYDVALSALFTMADSSTHTVEFTSRKALEQELKLAKELGFFSVPEVGAAFKLLPMSQITDIVVSEI